MLMLLVMLNYNTVVHSQMNHDEYNAYMREIRGVYRLDPDYRADQAAISKVR